MKTESVAGVRISSIVACIPDQLIGNDQSCAELFDNVETLIKATGISDRAIARPGTTALDLNVAAAKKAIEISGTSSEEIGAVVSVSFTPEYLMPSDAPSAQSRLGISTNTIAFDINMACSGYGYGLYIAALLANSTGKKVLLLDGDVQSAYVSQHDKATYPVMSDAGSATIIEPDPSSTVPWKFAFYTDGANREALYIPAGGSRHPATMESVREIVRPDGSIRSDTQIFMDGFEIFKFVAQKASHFIAEFLQEIDIEASEVDSFVPHQANMYMIELLTKKLGIQKSEMLRSGHLYGNPASASIPLTIAENRLRFSSDHQESTLIAGFGGGLSISVGLIDINTATKIDLIKLEGEYNAR